MLIKAEILLFAGEKTTGFYTHTKHKLKEVNEMYKKHIEQELADGKRPRLKIPFSKIEWILYFLGAAAIIFMIVLFMKDYTALPDTVATHFDFNGNPDGYGSKKTLFLLPVIGIISYIGIFILGFFPHIYNFPVNVTPKNAYKLYYTARVWLNAINMEMIWMFAGILFYAIRGAQGYEMNLMPFILIVIIVITFSSIIMTVRLTQAGKEED